MSEGRKGILLSYSSQICELRLIETGSAGTACALNIDRICQYVNKLISVRFTKAP